jgi:hypothetical protein
MTWSTRGKASAPIWEDAEMLRSFQLIAAGITDLVGFGAAVINLVRGDDLVVVAVAGIERGVTASGQVQQIEEMIGETWPLEMLDAHLAVADDWGSFKFVPAERSDDFDLGWIPEIEMLDGEDA